MEQGGTKLKPYADIAVVTGKYQKDGKERNRYRNIGVLFSTPHMSHMVIKLDTLPLGGEGWLSVFPREDAKPEKPNEQTNSKDVQF